MMKKIMHLKIVIPLILVALFVIGWFMPRLSPTSAQKVYEYQFDEKKFVDSALRIADVEFSKTPLQKFYIRHIQVKNFRRIPEIDQCQIRDAQGNEDFVLYNYTATVQAKTFFNFPLKQISVRCENYIEGVSMDNVPFPFPFPDSSKIELRIHNDKIQTVTILNDFSYSEGMWGYSSEPTHQASLLSPDDRQLIVSEINKNKFSELRANYQCQWWQRCGKDVAFTLVVSDFDSIPFYEHWVRCESYKACPQEFKNIVQLLESYSPKKFDIH